MFHIKAVFRTMEEVEIYPLHAVTWHNWCAHWTDSYLQHVVQELILLSISYL